MRISNEPNYHFLVGRFYLLWFRIGKNEKELCLLLAVGIRTPLSRNLIALVERMMTGYWPCSDSVDIQWVMLF